MISVTTVHPVWEICITQCDVLLWIEKCKRVSCHRLIHIPLLYPAAEDMTKKVHKSQQKAKRTNDNTSNLEITILPISCSKMKWELSENVSSTFAKTNSCFLFLSCLYFFRAWQSSFFFVLLFQGLRNKTCQDYLCKDVHQESLLKLQRVVFYPRFNYRLS